jgi:hypothetical protein
MISLVEYITGVMLVLVFKKRYWDYTDESLNIRGHVCLLYSLYWGGLSLLFERTFYPLALKLVSVMDMERMRHMNLLFGAVIFLDLVYSSRVIPRVLLTARRRFPFGRVPEEYLERLSAMPLFYAPAVQDNIRRLAGFLQERNREAGIFQRRLHGRYRRTRLLYRRRLEFIVEKLPMRGAMLLKEKILKIVKG